MQKRVSERLREEAERTCAGIRRDVEAAIADLETRARALDELQGDRARLFLLRRRVANTDFRKFENLLSRHLDSKTPYPEPLSELLIAWLDHTEHWDEFNEWAEEGGFEKWQQAMAREEEGETK